jgi:hypothetical protein
MCHLATDEGKVDFVWLPDVRDELPIACDQATILKPTHRSTDPSPACVL